MKKYILYITLLLIYLLTACTMLSQKIETEMLTQVSVRALTGTTPSYAIEMSPSVLFTSGNGSYSSASISANTDNQYKLYQVIDGNGWESGLRIAEADGWSYSSFFQSISIPGGKDYCFIRTASRMPKVGDMVEIIEQFTTAPDQYLVTFSEDTELSENIRLSMTMTLNTVIDNVLLIDMQNASFPFMPHTIQLSMPDLYTAKYVFSMTEIRDFLQGLPVVAILPGLLAVPILLWVISGFLLRNIQRHRILLITNFILSVCVTVGLYLILQRFDLPASMLPPSNILDISYYTAEFSVIFQSLDQLGMPEIYKLAMQTRDLCLSILLADAAAAEVLLALEIQIACRNIHNNPTVLR